MAEQKKSCSNCGATLLYAPGTTSIACEYCGNKQEVSLLQKEIQELDLWDFLETKGTTAAGTELKIVDCPSCGAKQNSQEHLKTFNCVFCLEPLTNQMAINENWIPPGAIVPFRFTKDEAQLRFQKWIDSLWWAPKALKKASLDPDFTRGLYLPFWTFDAQIAAQYTGERGTHYYVTRTVGSGKNRRTVRKRRTRWRAVSGSVSGFIDDALIPASAEFRNQIPSRIKNWNLKENKRFHHDFLAGFVTEKYTIPVKEGYDLAKQSFKQTVSNWVTHDIGGDAQRITQLELEKSKETFKHILLPLFVSHYRYKGKKYHFYVNGQTGVVSGERPYSPWKIGFAILGGLVLLLILYFIISSS